MQLLSIFRKRDVNINAAVAGRNGSIKFHCWNSVYDTISEQEAKEIRQKMGPEKEIIEVKTYRLETLLDKFLPINQSIDFFNIDAEGCDLEVLQSNNWSKYRPRLVVFEDHNNNIDEIMISQEVLFMKSVGYKLRSWNIISLIFILQEETA